MIIIVKTSEPEFGGEVVTLKYAVETVPGEEQFCVCCQRNIEVGGEILFGEDDEDGICRSCFSDMYDRDSRDPDGSMSDDVTEVMPL